MTNVCPGMLQNMFIMTSVTSEELNQSTMSDKRLKCLLEVSSCIAQLSAYSLDRIERHGTVYISGMFQCVQRGIL